MERQRSQTVVAVVANSMCLSKQINGLTMQNESRLSFVPEPQLQVSHCSLFSVVSKRAQHAHKNDSERDCSKLCFGARESSRSDSTFLFSSKAIAQYTFIHV